MRIDMIKGRSKKEIRNIMDIAYEVAAQEFHLLPHDRFQIVTQHDADEMIKYFFKRIGYFGNS